jgi:hypothetical protein
MTLKSLFWIALVGAVAYYFSNIKSSGFVDGFLFPMTFGLSVLAFVVWITSRISRRTGRRKGGNGSGADGGGGSDWFDGGCDGGGGDGGGD